MKSSPSSRKSIIFSDIKGKSIALAMGCFLWYYVNVITVEKSYISLPVVLENMPEDKDVEISKDELFVRVEILAHEDVSRRIEDLEAIIDLTDYNPGVHEYEIELKNLPNDIGAKIYPQVKEVAIYSIITNKVPLNVRVTPSEWLTNAKYSTTTVDIYGSTKYIGQVHSLNTANIDYTIPANNKLNTNVAILFPKGITIIGKPSVDVSLYFNQRKFTNKVALSMTYSNLSENLIVENTNSLMVTIVAPTSNIEPYLLETTMNVDLAGLAESGQYRLPINFNTPTNIVLINVPTEYEVILKSLAREVAVPENTFNKTLEASLEGLNTPTVFIDDTKEETSVNVESNQNATQASEYVESINTGISND